MTRPVTAIASRCLALPACSFPQVISKLQRIAADPDCSIPLVGSVLLSDPMFSALCLSRANIGVESGGTVSGAVAKLGLAGVAGLCEDIIPIPRQMRTAWAEHWAVANAAAHMTRLLARFCHCEFPQRHQEERLSLAGLLHDLGRPALQFLFPAEYQAAEQQLVGDPLSDFGACLRDQLGVTSQHVGALVARSWHLPAELRAVARWHHEPERCGEHAELVALVHVARALVRACGFTAGADIYVYTISDNALDRLGLRQRDLTTCIARFFEEMEELALYESSFAA